MLEIGLIAACRSEAKKKEPSKRLSKVNREASNRGRNRSVKSKELDTPEVNERPLIVGKRDSLS